MIKPRPLKRFGQNFLQDDQVIAQIIQVINPQRDESLVEIGPGRGALSLELAKHSINLHLIEIDTQLQIYLKQLPALNKVHLIEQDALKLDFSKISPNQQILRIVGNLPYNISTPLIFHALKFIDCIQDMHFMLQKEVVDRICAQPGTKTYGRLSVMVQYYCQTFALFEVPPASFFPVPKVMSAIIRLIPFRTLPYIAKDFNLFTEIVRQAFNMKRKTIQNSLKPYISGMDLHKLGIDQGLRAETLSVKTFVDIANFVTENKSP